MPTVKSVQTKRKKSEGTIRGPVRGWRVWKFENIEKAKQITTACLKKNGASGNALF